MAFHCQQEEGFHTLGNRLADSKQQTEMIDDDIAIISENSITRFVAIASVLVAAALLVGAIVALAYNTEQGYKILILATFTLFFAASASLFTSSGRVEIFAATAAYTAVLVVFMSGTQCCPTTRVNANG